jgi:hypothetical protein
VVGINLAILYLFFREENRVHMILEKYFETVVWKIYHSVLKTKQNKTKQNKKKMPNILN